ncbi:MAG: hypothetical protein RLY57_709 [Candidatus Parcubacteria bacterium]|jgi:hypothetical protein
MRKLLIVSLVILITGILIVFILHIPADTSHLEKEIKNTASVEYAEAFKIEAGTLVQFESFDMFFRGIIPLSLGQKFENWINNLKGMDGGYNSESYDIQIRSKDTKILYEFNLEIWPWSWEEFTVGNKTYKLKLENYGKEGVVSIKEEETL